MGLESLDEQVAALEEGRAYLELGAWPVAEIRGRDAEGWLDDLVTASLEGLEPGRTVRSLLLSPTGRIRADFLTTRTGEGAFLLVQGPGQPEALTDLLAPYVLSSDVEVALSSGGGLFLVPGPHGAWRVAPTAPEGAWVAATDRAWEASRIRRGVPRFPVDLDPDSLPAEAGLDVEPVIDRSKGCYLGQESVARVRNLGHPPRIVLGLRAEGAVAVGAPVLSAGARAGTVTSAERLNGGSAAIARIRWDARGTELALGDGTPLRPL